MKTTALICLLGLALNGPSLNAQVRIVPRDAVVEGLTLDEWSAEWWKWSLSIPCTVNPLVPTNDFLIHVGQTNSVFFLAASFSFGGNCAEVTTPSVRAVTIPADKYLLVPILNWGSDNLGREIPLTAEELRAEVLALAESVSDVSAFVNGVEIPNLLRPDNLLITPVYSYKIPREDDIYTCLGITNLTNVDAEGVVNPVVSGGYYLMLEPLPPGPHLIHTRASVGDPVNFCVEVIYRLEVESRSPAKIVPPGSIVEGLTLEEWSAEWWKWVLSIPANPCETHPWFNTSDATAQVGQTGPVFFLTAGVSAGGTYQYSARPVTIPHDKYVFFPILNGVFDNVGRQIALTAEQLREEMLAQAATISEVWAVIDDLVVTNLLNVEYFLNSPVFSYSIPLEDNFYFCLGFSNLTHVDSSGVVNPAVSGGYWLMLEPLPPGTHVINTRGAYGSPVELGFDATYIVIVESESLADRFQKLRDSISEAGIPRGRQQSLLASLNAASNSFEHGRLQLGINQMEAFQHKVRAILGKENPAFANDLARAVQQIVDHARSESK